MQNGRKNHPPPLVAAVRQVMKLIYPLHVRVGYSGRQAKLTLPTYHPQKTGFLCLRLTPKGMVITTKGEFNKYREAVHRIVRTIPTEGGE